MRKMVFGGCLVALFLLTVIIDISFAQSAETDSQFHVNDQIFGTQQNETEEVEIQLNTGYWKSYISDTKSILTSPSRWERSDWIKTSLVLGTTFGLYIFDQNIQDWVQDHRDDSSDDIANFAKPFGNGLYLLPSLGVYYLYGHFFASNKAKRTGLLGLESFIVSGVFTQAIKFTGHRHRPDTGDDYDTWDGPSFSSNHLSFPSGHSSTAFSIATVIASEYDHIVFIPPLAYGIATLTALSRVHLINEAPI
jgi:membrane-associated phospholipid phosphatase